MVKQNVDEESILVTGAAGFIGSHTIVKLLEANFKVIAVDNLSNAAPPENGTDLPPSLERVIKIMGPKYTERLSFIRGDFGDSTFLDSVFNSHKISCVMHLGGFKAVGESKEKPLMYYKNNVAGTINMLESMKKHSVFFLIFSSSATVYTEPTADDLPLTETSKVGNCTCPYANTKLFTENILKDLCYSDKSWKVVSLRYFNPVGAHESGEIGEDPKGIPNNLMPYIAQVAIGRRTHLNVFGNDYDTSDGTGVRDYIHVVDLAKGHVDAIKRLDHMKGFAAYNLGTGVGTSVLEMVSAFEKAAGKKINYKICERRPGDIATVYCDPTLAENELGWKAEKTIKDMCNDLWKFQCKNPSGYALAKK